MSESCRLGVGPVLYFFSYFSSNREGEVAADPPPFDARVSSSASQRLRPRPPVRPSSAERCDQRAVGNPAARAQGQVEERARLAVRVHQQLEPAVGAREAGHVPDVLGVVSAPQAPLADCERLARVALVERLLLAPLDSRLAVDVVADDVDVAVSRVVALRLVRREFRGLRRPAGSRSPSAHRRTRPGA
jgi:hypothetical protein